jgi:glycerol-3-phosphate dehydrogenase
MTQAVAEHLVETYGCRAWEVCESGSLAKLHPDFNYVEAEVVYACREYACTIEDVLSRRTRLAVLNKAAAMECMPKVAEIMKQHLGWSGRVQRAQMDAARAYISTYGGPDKMANDGARETMEQMAA